jgi:hypothetical protein
MSFINDRFRCQSEVCGFEDDVLQRRSERAEWLACPECKATTFKRVPWANVTAATYVDGTRRFSDIKAHRELERDMRRARRKRRRDEVKEIKAEMAKAAAKQTTPDRKR